ncbi:transcriptional activator of glycolytic enzymes-domain-containing protein [Fusarium oxysporum f. sp. albedinis]|nr:transcriptional activator of glycolytic enzymes-domain-containing protein [Fusarium oxysporum f. sp. albedinis]
MPVVAALAKVFTVRDVWKEWEEGIAGQPAVRVLEETWGSRWRPGNGIRVQFCRRKVIWDELFARTASGKSEEEAVAELELLRAGRSLNRLVDELKQRRRRGQGQGRIRVQVGTPVPDDPGPGPRPTRGQGHRGRWARLGRRRTAPRRRPITAGYYVPAYLTAPVLHPAFRWSTAESQWADHPDWLIREKAAVQELWEEYQNLSVEQGALPEQPTIARKATDLDDFMASIRKLSTQPAPSPSAIGDKYAEWVATTDPGDCLVDDPIQYWLLRRRQYPRLSQMAIDLFSIPAIPSEPERIFSLAGQIVTAGRGRLCGSHRSRSMHIVLGAKWGYPDIQIRSKSI